MTWPWRMELSAGKNVTLASMIPEGALGRWEWNPVCTNLAPWWEWSSGISSNGTWAEATGPIIHPYRWDIKNGRDQISQRQAKQSPTLLPGRLAVGLLRFIQGQQGPDNLPGWFCVVKTTYFTKERLFLVSLKHIKALGIDFDGLWSAYVTKLWSAGPWLDHFRC